ncbi:unnamed protein product [Parnassius apollo]|uniref:(apollo) hypothetical protein n=1 Tax=Parnassius apollo TaxID=110799 RepID=A0A8S3XI38_PARAO|nr:unnamed protein product [Parnassius apollo]
MFGLPLDPDQSEDDEESDEDNVLQYHNAILQRILEDLDEPGLRSLDIMTASPQPSTSSDEPDPRCFVRFERASLSPKPSMSNAELPSSAYPGTVQTARRQGSGYEMGKESGREIGQKRRAEKSRDHGDSGSESEVESETNASDENEDTWKKKLWTDKRPQPDTFNSVPMIPSRMLPSNARPVRHFEKFFTQEIIDLIIRETNRYANQNNVVGWTEIYTKELQAFLAILIVMGYHILPSLELYWSSDLDFRVENDEDSGGDLESAGSETEDQLEIEQLEQTDEEDRPTEVISSNVSNPDSSIISEETSTTQKSTAQETLVNHYMERRLTKPTLHKKLRANVQDLVPDSSRESSTSSNEASGLKKGRFVAIVRIKNIA